MPSREEKKMAKVVFNNDGPATWAVLFDDFQISQFTWSPECESKDTPKNRAYQLADILNAAVSRLVSAERERCAKIAESMYDKTYWDDPSAGIAASIRREGQP